MYLIFKLGIIISFPILLGHFSLQSIMLLSKTSLLIFAILCWSWVNAQNCGYESCPKQVDGKLNVHLLCHSHDDVGWLKKVDEYYYGSSIQRWDGWSENQRAGVQYIIDSVVKELAFDPKKRYFYLSTIY